LQPTHHPILLVVHVIYDNFPILPIDIDIVGGSAKEICNFLSRNVHVIIFFEQVDQLFESHDTIQMQRGTDQVQFPLYADTHYTVLLCVGTVKQPCSRLCAEIARLALHVLDRVSNDVEAKTLSTPV